jgi:hypothetical protein
MPPNNTIMPLPDTDHVAMNCPRNDFYDRVYSLPEKTQQYIANTTHRLAEIDWITRTLEDQVRSDRSPVTHEGILSLQVYLLLTCADTLGHLSAGGRVGARFRGFFENLPSDAKQNLFNNLLFWFT